MNRDKDNTVISKGVKIIFQPSAFVNMYHITGV